MLTEAIEILADAPDAKDFSLLGHTLRQRTELLDRMNRGRNAYQSAVEALVFWRRMMDVDHNAAMWQLALAFEALAELLHQRGLAESALIAIEQSLAIVARMNGDGPVERVASLGMRIATFRESIHEGETRARE